MSAVRGACRGTRRFGLWLRLTTPRTHYGDAAVVRVRSPPRLPLFAALGAAHASADIRRVAAPIADRDVPGRPKAAHNAARSVRARRARREKGRRRRRLQRVGRRARRRIRRSTAAAESGRSLRPCRSDITGIRSSSTTACGSPIPRLRASSTTTSAWRTRRSSSRAAKMSAFGARCPRSR